MLLNEKRVLLIGGKGGVGKTTISSALAVLASSRGIQVLLVSTDPAHSLADVFARPIGDCVTTLAPNLDGLELDPDREVERHLASVTTELKRFTRPEMFSEIERQMRLNRLSPGVQEAAMLERIAQVIQQGLQDYHLVIFDTAPTGHTLRLLSLPETMSAWTQGLLNANKRAEKLAGVLAHLTPRAGRDVANPLAEPTAHATDGMDQRSKNIAQTLLARQRLFQQTRKVLTDPRQSAFVFVLTPEKLPILETRRAVYSLQQEQLPLAGLVINRILPDSADGAFIAQRRAQQSSHLNQIEQDFVDLPRYHIPLQTSDIYGLSALTNMANLLEQAGF